jgi:hypothetical protein
MPRPLPNATASFKAGALAKDTVKYPHLPRSVPVKAGHTTYPSLTKAAGRRPATHRPMGMTLPILTKMGGHPLDTASMLPPVGNA